MLGQACVGGSTDGWIGVDASTGAGRWIGVVRWIGVDGGTGAVRGTGVLRGAGGGTTTRSAGRYRPGSASGGDGGIGTAGAAPCGTGRPPWTGASNSSGGQNGSTSRAGGVGFGPGT
jgi:hypothetical protein